MNMYFSWIMKVLRWMQVWIQMELIWVYVIQLYAYLKLQV